MSVNVHNEWDPLEEVVIGTALGARVPVEDFAMASIEYPRDPGGLPSGPFPRSVIEETEEELEKLCDELAKVGVRVRRPSTREIDLPFSTPEWSSDGFYDYCPRDCLLTVGDAVIETPMVYRSRFLESFAYRDLLLEYLKGGARWFSAPKPRLSDELFAPERIQGERLRNLEPAFDAANVLRFGTDILYLVSDSGNEMGARWLRSILGPEYTVHEARDMYASTHIDSTVVPIRPGLVLLNPARINDDNIPDFLRGWDRLWCPEVVDIGHTGDRALASRWIGMNLLMIRPDLAVVDDRQIPLIRALESYGVDVLPLRLTHSRTLGGGFHCVSLDVRRRGKLETYR